MEITFRTSLLKLLAGATLILSQPAFSQDTYFAENDDGSRELGFQGSENQAVGQACGFPLGRLGGSTIGLIGDSASSGVLNMDSNLYTVASFDTSPWSMGDFTLFLTETDPFGDAFGTLGKVIVEFIETDEQYPERGNSSSLIDAGGYTEIGVFDQAALFNSGGLDISNAVNSILNQPDHKRYMFVRLRFELCQNGNNMGDSIRIAGSGDAGRIHVVGTSSGLLPVDGSLAGSWFNVARNGEGAVVDIFDNGGDRVVVLYLYSYTNDGMGDQIYLVGSGAIVANQLTMDMGITNGPTFGPGYDTADYLATLWGTITLVFVSCSEIQITYDSPTYGMGTLTMNRLGLPIQGVTGVCSG